MGRSSHPTMTPIERACLYGIGLLAGIATIFRTVDLWIKHLEKRYWAKKKL